MSRFLVTPGILLAPFAPCGATSIPARPNFLVILADDLGYADPLRGYKMLTWEGGLRVPCIASWPGKIPANSTSDASASNYCHTHLARPSRWPRIARKTSSSTPSSRRVPRHLHRPPPLHLPLSPSPGSRGRTATSCSKSENSVDF